MSGKSIVYWYSSLDKHLCGYCKNERGNLSHGMWAKTLTVEDYQNLIDRGWRRSGHYCYKPVMDKICCPMYTIKCDALNFQPSKSQKKVIKKFNKFLKDGIVNKTENNNPHDTDGGSHFVYRDVPAHLSDEQSTIDTSQVSATEQTVVISDGNWSREQIHFVAGTSPKPPPKTGVGADPSKPLRKKAKVLRLERKQEKLLKRGMSLETIQLKNKQKPLEEFLAETSADDKHELKLQLVCTSSEEYESLQSEEFALYKKYQMAVHDDPPEKCTMAGFQRFLVKSPLKQLPFGKDSDLGFGSYHQLYWLDDKLVAVGVIDILPKCVSAVYFFYDPDYRDLTLGTYGSLREVEFVRSVCKLVPSVQYYYMGFYIHSCPKMRYKGKLTPSFLACPETYSWVPVEKCFEKLEVSKYSKLEEDEDVVDENLCDSKDVDEIKVLCSNRKIVPFKQYKRTYGEQSLYDTVAQLIGKKCSKSIIFISDY